MNRHLLPLALLALAATAAPTAGQPLAVDLPDLQGVYDSGDDLSGNEPTVRATTFTLPPEVAGLGGLRLVLTLADDYPGAYESCRILQGFTVCDTLPTVAGLAVAITADPLGDCVFQASGSIQEDWSAGIDLVAVCPGEPVGVDALIGVPVRAELSSPPRVPAGHDLLAPAGVTVVAARLEPLGVVPDDETTWSTVKARYR